MGGNRAVQAGVSDKIPMFAANRKVRWWTWW